MLSSELLRLLRRGIDLMSIPSGQKFVVGYSGGKDSLILCVALRELGHTVYPVTIDLGYANFDASAISQNIETLGFRPAVVTAHHDTRLVKLTAHQAITVRRNLSYLESPEAHNPCGPCSQTKRTLLHASSVQRGVRWIALAHHREDFLSTLLKDYFINEYYREMGAYDAESFRCFIASHLIATSVLERMIAEEKASTMSARLSLSRHVELVRPLLFVPEMEIRGAVQGIGVRTFGSGCSHAVFDGTTAVPITKREIVHAELTRRLSEDISFGTSLLNVALTSLTAEGRARFINPRSSRPRVLPDFEGKG